MAYPIAWLTSEYTWLTRQSWPNPNIAGSSFWSAGKMTRPITKIVLHSTETTGFPGYHNASGQAGANCPHFTINLVTGETRQHIPLTDGGRALRTGATIEANTGGVIQVEVIGAVTPGYPAKYGHYDLVNTFPNDLRAQFHLARLLRVIRDATGGAIPMVSTVTWVTYPESYGMNASQRLSVAQYLAYAGVLGHQHVPGNDHGDPGALPGLRQVMALALTLNPHHTYDQHKNGAPPVSTTPDQNGYLPDEYGSLYHIARVQTGLAALGFYDGPIRGGIGPMTEAAILAFQKSDPVLADDGQPGPATTAALTKATDVPALAKAHVAALSKVKADAAKALKAALADAAEDHAEELSTLRAALEAETAEVEAERDALAARVAELEARLAQPSLPAPVPVDPGDAHATALLTTAAAQAGAILTRALAATAPPLTPDN